MVMVMEQLRRVESEVTVATGVGRGNTGRNRANNDIALLAIPVTRRKSAIVVVAVGRAGTLRVAETVTVTITITARLLPPQQ
jgi:hypothetical protein